MIHNFCLTRSDFWFYFFHLFHSKRGQRNTFFRKLMINTSWFIFTVRILSRANNLFRRKKVLGISLEIKANASLICKSILIPFAEKGNILLWNNNCIIFYRFYCDCGIFNSANLSHEYTTWTGEIIFWLPSKQARPTCMITSLLHRYFRDKLYFFWLFTWICLSLINFLS